MSKSKMFAIALGVVALVLVAFTVVQAQNSIMAQDNPEQGQSDEVAKTATFTKKPGKPTETKPGKPTKTKHPPHKTKHPPPPPPPRPIPGGPGNLEFIVFYATLGILLLSVIGIGFFLRKKSQKQS